MKREHPAGSLPNHYSIMDLPCTKGFPRYIVPEVQMDSSLPTFKVCLYMAISLTWIMLSAVQIVDIQQYTTMRSMIYWHLSWLKFAHTLPLRQSCNLSFRKPITVAQHQEIMRLCLNIHARGFWGNWLESITFDLIIFNPIGPSYRTSPPASC